MGKPKPIFDQNRRELKLEASRAIMHGLKLSKGTNYKRKIPIHELIDLKKSSDNDRFIAYVEMTTGIREYLEETFPYLNLEHIDLQWTGDELTKECIRQHDIFVENARKMEKIETITPERLKGE